ncbi:MAG: hypothetical protein ACRCSN_18185, partial [Dermatophilaceae bacterium]
MGFLNRLLGRPMRGPAASAPSSGPTSAAPAPPMPGASEDERAVARYRYLLRTASPEQLEAVHAEAFSTLTSEQRQQLLREFT